MFEHASYSAAVTSWRSMQNGESVTWWEGFSSALPSSAPMKNLPPAMRTVSLGHDGGGGATRAALADIEGPEVESAAALGARVRRNMSAPPTPRAAVDAARIHGTRDRGRAALTGMGRGGMGDPRGPRAPKLDATGKVSTAFETNGSPRAVDTGTPAI